MQELELQSLLPRGTPTFEPAGTQWGTTLDLMLASEWLTDAKTKCQIYYTDHGSDHRAIETEFQVRLQEVMPSVGRRRLEKARWPDICRELHQQLGLPEHIPDVATLERSNDQFMGTVQATIEDMVPIATPFPYTKRWWSYELTNLHKEYTRWRNKWTTLKRRGDIATWAAEKVQQARQVYFAEIQRRKR